MSAESINNDIQEAERPLECSECKKKIAVCYSELQENRQIQKFVGCDDCPIVYKKLYGSVSAGTLTLSTEELSEKKNCFSSDNSTSLCCRECGLTREELRMGSLIGCSFCYEVFTGDIINELVALNRIPIKTGQEVPATSLHIGRRVNSSYEGNLSVKLVSLQEVLHETLQREDYEQAATLRDQINEVTEKIKNQLDVNE